MIDFAKVQSVTIPEGEVVQIEAGGKVIWKDTRYRYVSLGDSIAAGHTINEDWEKNYGEGSQYGMNGNTSTVIVPNSYTDLIRTHLENTHGKGCVKATSFARSGDTVAALMNKLAHPIVRRAIARANLVTICIGANDVLQPAMSGLGGYINTGNMDDLAKDVEAHLTTLNTDGAATSYKALFDKLMEINPNATYVFTTIYNPYKYLWVEQSTGGANYKDGFFGPLMWAIPDALIGESLANMIRKAFYETSAVQNMLNRINAIGGIAEGFITRLNAVLRNKINAYGKPNIVLADTKAVFDPIPDRPISAPRHYNDLVSVEITRGLNIEQMDWGKFWTGVDWLNAVSNIDKIAETVVNGIVNEVILPDTDPHPEEYGHYALKCSFADALGWATIPRRTITYNANGGSGSMASETVVALDNLTAYTTIPNNAFGVPGEGYYFTGWQGSNSTSYSAGQLVGLTGNLVLNAQWSDVYTIWVHHSHDAATYPGSKDTGPQGCYAIWIDGVEQPDLGSFSNGAREYTKRYNSQIGVIVQTESGSGRSYITLNGTKIAGNSGDARYTFTIKSHMDIHLEWNWWLDGISPQSYWIAEVTTY